MSKYEIKVIGPITSRQAKTLANLLRSKEFNDETAVPCHNLGGELVALWEIVQSWNPNGLLVDGKPSKNGSFELLNSLLNVEAQPLIGYLVDCPTKGGSAQQPTGLTVKAAVPQPTVQLAVPQPTVQVAVPQQTSLEAKVDRLEGLVSQMLDQLTAPQSPQVAAPQPSSGHQIVLTDDGPMELVKGRNGKYYVRQA